MILANQHLGQIDTSLQGEILANTDIKISGLNNPEMAKKVVTSLNISMETFTQLKEHEFYIKTNDRTAYKVKPPGMLIKPKHYTKTNYNPYLLHYSELQELKSIAKVWDLVGNRSYFPKTLALIRALSPSLFSEFRGLAREIQTKFGRTHGIDLMELAESVFHFLTKTRGQDPAHIASALLQDLKVPEVRSVPKFLRAYFTHARSSNPSPGSKASPAPKRQQRIIEAKL